MGDKKTDAIPDDDAIQKKDVSDADVEVDQRDVDMEVIIERRNAELIEESKPEEPEPDPDDDPEKKQEKDEKSEPDPDDDPLKDKTEKIVVRGKTEEVPLSKVIDAGKRTLQKESAADEYLKETKTILHDMKTLRDELKKPPKKDEPESDATKDLSDEDLLGAIRYGNDETGLAAIKALRGRNSESFTPEEVGELIDNKLQEREKDKLSDHEADTKKKINEFLYRPVDKGGFADLMKNEILFNQTKFRVEQLVASGKGSYEDIETYKEAGNWVREFVLGERPAEKSDDNNNQGDLEKKKNLKREKDNIKPASGEAARTDKSDDVVVSLEKSRKDTIQEMIKDRQAGRT